LALQLLVLLINFSNLALANRVFSGQASSRITDYPNCAKPWTLAATYKLYMILDYEKNIFITILDIVEFIIVKTNFLFYKEYCLKIEVIRECHEFCVI